MDAEMTIAVVQDESVPGEIDRNVRVLEAHVQTAAERGADVVVTPELFSTGYDPQRAPSHDGAEIRTRLADLARRHRVAVVGSTIESVDEGPTTRHRIVATFWDLDGQELGRSAKAHLYGEAEKRHLASGGYGAVFSWRGFRCAMGTCYDVEFPEFVRHGARAGADVFFIPTAVPALRHREPGRSEAWSYDAAQTSLLQVPTRALENGVAIAYANHAGRAFTGHSCIVTPYGRHAALLESGAGTALASISRRSIMAARDLNTYLVDVEVPLQGRIGRS